MVSSSGLAIAAGEPDGPERPAEISTHQAPVVQPGAPAVSQQRITLEQELQLIPERPGVIAVTVRYTIPSGVAELQTRIPPGGTVTSARGFIRRDGTEYVWNRRTPSPSVAYRLPVNETIDATGPIAGRGDYAFVDTGNWALVRIPPTATNWSRTRGGPSELTRTVTTAGPGAVGAAIAFLGEYREVRRVAHDQTFRLIVPARADLAASPAELLDSVTAASDTLRVGDRDSEVFMIAAPTGQVQWGVRGLQTGGSDFWVRDTERLDTADNVWIHEYVHTRQRYTTGTQVRWFTEASATYYGALLTLEQDRIGFDAFRDRLAIASQSESARAVLSDPTTWDDDAPYLKGALVAGELDRRTRQATSRTRSLQDVFHRMNNHHGTVTAAEFRDLVRTAAGDEVATLASRYTTTQEMPSMWDRTDHHQQFSVVPPRISYLLPTMNVENSSGYRVSGPYREGLISGGQSLHLAVGETLTFDVTVRNTGGSAGEYDARLFVNGDPQARRTGRLDPDQTATLTFTPHFTEPGEYALSIGGNRVHVSVHEPLMPTITDLRVATATVSPNTEVSAVLTIRNEHEFPAAGTFTLRLNGVPIETVSVKLGPNEERSVTINRTLSTAGEHVFRVDGRTAVVMVESTPANGETTRGQTDGFGMAAALIAIGILLLVRQLQT